MKAAVQSCMLSALLLTVHIYTCTTAERHIAYILCKLVVTQTDSANIQFEYMPLEQEITSLW